jgi:hypothetical protein
MTSSYGGESAEARCGRLLASAEGYTVVRENGGSIGALAYVRYRTRTHRPDEIVVRSGRFWRRLRRFDFEAVQAVDPRARRITVTGQGSAARRSRR